MTVPVIYECTKRDGAARAGLLRLPHGDVPTPAFMPVGTAATVKGMTPSMLRDAGVQMVLANAWHLMLRPGVDLIEAHGGVHRFMQWESPILTDSGGFQTFSLARFVKVSEEGVRFQSPYNGDVVDLTPEESMRAQRRIGADVIMAFDECTAYPADEKTARISMERSMRWATRCRAAHEDGDSVLFGIVQGGVYPELREASAAALSDIGFAGYAVGGLSVGESAAERGRMLDVTLPLLPEQCPRYLMGVGRPADIVAAVRRGVDMFDCVIPTRNARNGLLYVRGGELRLRNAEFKDDTRPIDESCECYTCRHFSRAYLRHLDKCGEMMASILSTIHNVHYFQQLMSALRVAITEGRLDECARSWVGATKEQHGER